MQGRRLGASGRRPAVDRAQCPGKSMLAFGVHNGRGGTGQQRLSSRVTGQIGHRGGFSAITAKGLASRPLRRRSRPTQPHCRRRKPDESCPLLPWPRSCRRASASAALNGLGAVWGHFMVYCNFLAIFSEQAQLRAAVREQVVLA